MQFRATIETDLTDRRLKFEEFFWRERIPGEGLGGVDFFAAVGFVSSCTLIL